MSCISIPALCVNRTTKYNLVGIDLDTVGEIVSNTKRGVILDKNTNRKVAITTNCGSRFCNTLPTMNCERAHTATLIICCIAPSQFDLAWCLECTN